MNQVSTDGQLIRLAGFGTRALGIEDPDLLNLHGEISNYYQKLEADPMFAELPTLLNYSFSSAKPEVGKATVYQPKQINDQTRTIVFLHGFGGSFHYYLHYMISCFPDDIIICPVYGLSPYKIEHQYVQEAIEAGLQKIEGQPNGKPYLVCLSAGGFGGYRLAASYPQEYPKLVVMGAGPPDDLPKVIRSEVRLLVGAEEAFYKYGDLRDDLKNTIAKGQVKGHAIKGAGHFFMMTHKDETRRVLKGWLNRDLEN